MEGGQSVQGLVLLCVLIEYVFVDMLFQVSDLGDVRIVLVIDVVCHEINAHKLALYLTQVHFSFEYYLSFLSVSKANFKFELILY